MMPDRYDELRKRLLVPQPIAQEEDSQIDYNQAVDDSGMPIEKTPVPVAPAITPEIRRAMQDKADTNRALSNLIVSAGSALTGFGSGTAAEQSSRFDQSNKYLQNIGTLEADKLKKLKEIKNENGQPEFIAESNAIGMEPYHQIKTAGGLEGGAAKSFTTFDVYRPTTQERFNAVFNTRLGKYQDANGDVIQMEPTDVLKPVANKIIKTEDVGGTVKVKEYNQYDKKPTKEIVTEPGLGPKYGVGTKGQGESIEKGVAEGQKEYQAYSGAIQDIKSATNTIKNGKNARALSAAIYSLVRSVEPKGVLTEQDFSVISGNAYMPTLQQIEDYVAKRFSGNLEEVRASFGGLAEDIQKRLEKRMISIPERFAPGSKQAQDAIKSVIPQDQMKKIKNQDKAKLIQIESEAKKFFGKNKKAYDGFMAKKKQEMGL